jgi:hypothetical protein
MVKLSFVSDRLEQGLALAELISVCRQKQKTKPDPLEKTKPDPWTRSNFVSVSDRLEQRLALAELLAVRRQKQKTELDPPCAWAT